MHVTNGESPVTLTAARQREAKGASTALEVGEGARRGVELEDALRRQHELLESIFDTVPLMMTIYEPSTNVLRVNRAFERLIGWSSGELAAVSLMEQCYPDPEYREQAREFMQACRPEWRDWCVTTRDGSVIDSSWTNVRLSDDTQLGIGIDVTERKRADENLRRSEERFQLAAMATRDAMWDLDVRTGKFWWSESINPVCGHHGMKAELELRDWTNLIHPDDRERALAQWTTGGSAQDTSDSVEFRFRRGDGSYAHILNRALVVRNHAGEPIRVVGTMTDITANKQAEAALRESEEALRQAHRLKDEFLALLAHELRNPLAPMRNAVEILRNDRASGAAAGRAIAILDRQLGLMVHLVNDLLDVSRINTGKIDLHRKNLDLNAVVQKAVESCQPLFDSKEQKLCFEPSVGSPPIVHGDATRLEQVFANLLHNAAKFTPTCGAVRISTQRHSDQATVRVHDTGVGISSEILPHVFDIFVQADRSVARAHGGLGIGLSLVKRLIDLHGGNVEAFSAGVGHGSEFVVRLPLRARVPEMDFMPVRVVEASRTETRDPARRTVMVVDDNVDAAATLARLLSTTGHDVLVAHDGRSGIELGKTRELDAIVMDLGMPGMSGYSAARLIRADPQLYDVLLIALTGWHQEEARLESTKAGFDHHLVKPVELAVLQEVLGRPNPRRRRQILGITGRERGGAPASK